MQETTTRESLNPPETPAPKWPLWLGLFVLFGSVATVAYTLYESWWG